MEDTISKKRVNQGLNLKMARHASEMKQEIIAQKLGITQQNYSRYEQMRVLDDEIIDKCAEIIGVEPDVIRKTEQNEDLAQQIFRDVKFSNTKSSISAVYASENHITNHFCDNEVVDMIKDNLRLLKGENETLREENKILRAENETIKKNLEEKDKNSE